MRIAVLTTDTLHHAHFVRELQAALPLASVILETRAVAPPFPCRHGFEDERDEYERDLFFGGRPASVKDFAPAREFPSANDAAAVEELRRAEAEWVLVFGTGLLKAPVLEAYPGRVLNLHGGDPEEYRGLDSHLWAIYHGDFGALVTTLHHAAASLDTGDIILQGEIPLRSGMALSELRAANTSVCLGLCKAALAHVAQSGKAPSRKQTKLGRYYSFMPGVLKEVCVKRFRAKMERPAAGPGIAA